jgi:hypothetical protein
MFYRLHLNQDLSGGKLTFSVTAQDMDEPLLSGHIPSPTLKGTQLGILTGFSQSARFRGIRAPRR